MKRWVGTLGTFLLLGLGGGAWIVATGAFDVSAGWKDPAWVRWLLVNTRENSIKRRAHDLAPADLDRQRRIDEGFRSYREMCAICHTPPGQKDSPVSAGLNPPPPDLAESAKEMSASELFWVIKNGIRMTGMPAWGKTHDDTELWDIVAFLKILPDLDEKGYEALDVKLAPGHHHGEAGHSHSHGASSSAVAEEPLDFSGMEIE